MAAPTSYVAVGGKIGRDEGGFHVGPSLEVGHRLHGSLWLHGMVEDGLLLGDNPYSGEFDRTVVLGSRFAVRGGLEERLPIRRDGVSGASGMTACLLAGLDVGYRHEQFAAEYYPRPAIDDGVVFERIGIDIGGDRIRFRPTIENTSSETNPFDGLAFTANLALTW